jgi:hypothetical protein
MDDLDSLALTCLVILGFILFLLSFREVELFQYDPQVCVNLYNCAAEDDVLNVRLSHLPAKCERQATSIAPPAGRYLN